MRRILRVISALLILFPCLFAQFGSGIQETIVDNNFGKVTGAAAGRLYTVSMRVRF